MNEPVSPPVLGGEFPATGYGNSFGSFGEIVQGRLDDGTDFLITLPIRVWNTCQVICAPTEGPVVVGCPYEKSRAIAYEILEVLGIDRGFRVEIELTRQLPVGKGLSSSTADMLAVTRAFEQVFGVKFSTSFISALFTGIEPHDGLHYETCVVYNHRKGMLIADLNYIPQFHIVAVDDGGMVDTVEYNGSIRFSKDDTKYYQDLFQRVTTAFLRHDDTEIADCATASTLLQGKRTKSEFLAKAVEVGRSMNAMGVIATHSGTCAGLLYPAEIPADRIADLALRVREIVGRNVFVTRTLQLFA